MRSAPRTVSLSWTAGPVAAGAAALDGASVLGDSDVSNEPSIGAVEDPAVESPTEAAEPESAVEPEITDELVGADEAADASIDPPEFEFAIAEPEFAIAVEPDEAAVDDPVDAADPELGDTEDPDEVVGPADAADVSTGAEFEEVVATWATDADVSGGAAA
ncbi:hypothetical protein KRP22_003705 [Phytophthora ramorum]|nr:hypothetical protein KRP22_9638 [Phytophthora ramorum]